MGRGGMLIPRVPSTGNLRIGTGNSRTLHGLQSHSCLSSEAFVILIYSDCGSLNTLGLRVSSAIPRCNISLLPG